MIPFLCGRRNASLLLLPFSFLLPPHALLRQRRSHHVRLHHYLRHCFGFCTASCIISHLNMPSAMIEPACTSGNCPRLYPVWTFEDGLCSSCRNAPQYLQPAPLRRRGLNWRVLLGAVLWCPWCKLRYCSGNCAAHKASLRAMKHEPRPDPADAEQS